MLQVDHMRPAAYSNRLNVHVVCVQVLHLCQCKCKLLGGCLEVAKHQSCPVALILLMIYLITQVWYTIHATICHIMCGRVSAT